ncbi:MAG TPA: hypothetical protein ENI23_10595 [bacterium]|nr:hypothetical protein [bacterium]
MSHQVFDGYKQTRRSIMGYSQRQQVKHHLKSSVAAGYINIDEAYKLLKEWKQDQILQRDRAKAAKTLWKKGPRP